MNLVWWEKTIEYCFVVLVAQKLGRAFVMPLSGSAESSMGDVVINNDFTFTLIEFKRQKSDMVSELSKYNGNDYVSAVVALSHDSGHHKILFGKQSGSELGIMVTNYFNGGIDEMPLDVTTVFKQGVSREDFEKYITDLAMFRKKDGRTGRSFNPADLQNVYGVTRYNEYVTWSLSEYCQTFLPKLVPTLSYEDRESEYSEPEYSFDPE